jgi:hypothetical protein
VESYYDTSTELSPEEDAPCIFRERKEAAQMAMLKTAMFLRELEKHGFTEAAFRKLHHFGEKARLKSFRKYSERVDFRANGTNAVVEQRLELVLRSFLLGGFTKPEAFIHLAEAVRVEIA